MFKELKTWLLKKIPFRKYRMSTSQSVTEFITYWGNQYGDKADL